MPGLSWFLTPDQLAAYPDDEGTRLWRAKVTAEAKRMLDTLIRRYFKGRASFMPEELIMTAVNLAQRFGLELCARRVRWVQPVDDVPWAPQVPSHRRDERHERDPDWVRDLPKELKTAANQSNPMFYNRHPRWKPHVPLAERTAENQRNPHMYHRAGWVPFLPDALKVPANEGVPHMHRPLYWARAPPANKLNLQTLMDPSTVALAAVLLARKTAGHRVSCDDRGAEVGLPLRLAVELTLPDDPQWSSRVFCVRAVEQRMAELFLRAPDVTVWTGCDFLYHARAPEQVLMVARLLMRRAYCETLAHLVHPPHVMADTAMRMAARHFQGTATAHYSWGQARVCGSPVVKRTVTEEQSRHAAAVAVGAYECIGAPVEWPQL